VILKALLQKPVCKKLIPSIIKLLRTIAYVFWPFLLVEIYILHKLVKVEYYC